ncbi:hypothetical protein VSAK1_02879 [Vibrio mediterranei AK1]|uniref:hypothetical protein n=1 Tax=Vibrio mediterranei TaxID=689 RepID=UPI0001540B25|nr:hypothetical protein [Vibrio mediterranei]EDL54982.1 hypothetical protein VSAK1_02879 [Vibrio mediterranei AK1]
MILFDCPRELREIIVSLVRANVSPIIVRGLSVNILYIHKKYIDILGCDEQDIFKENVVISHPDSFSTNHFIRKSLLSGVIDEMEINKIYQRKRQFFSCGT